MAHVWVAMSGGVDSSVAAALLLEQGHQVTGVTMRLLCPVGDEGGPVTDEVVRAARCVCDALGIPHRVMDFRDAFEREVVSPFARHYAVGLTPNPCVTCNEKLKFGALFAAAKSNGAEMLATGHYARLVTGPDGRRWLARGVDEGKDQSYFLYRLSAEQLEHIVLPVGGLTKSEVRAIAHRMSLPTAMSMESQDICFTSGEGHLTVVAARAPEALRAGDIVDAVGRVVGRHRGIAAYTVGQRSGLGIGGPGGPYFVLRLDAALNRIVVGPREALAVSRVIARDTVWRGDATQRLKAMVRYRMSAVDATVHLSDGELTVDFAQPLLGVALGQSLVCYRDDVVVGGGFITCAS